jgi:serine/threonine-protein kinase
MATGRDPVNLARAFEGRSFGGYRIARAIATGGMATVFLARRTGPGRFAQTAALKVIHPHLAAEAEFVDMFLEEARIASSINHPNVCRVLDFGQAEGTFYLAMEYVRGETWATTLQVLQARRESRARLPGISAYVIAQACEGLHAVHEAVDSSGHPLGIVHRDISPQNLFVAYDGSVRVLDFGIASARDRVPGSTTQVVKGRYAYMAPEQVRGLELDRRADIWSLGVVLREALTGERLFERDTQVATIMAVTKEPLPTWPRQVPLMLREVCDKALERDEAERFGTARDLGSALGRYLSSELEQVGGAELGRFMRQAFPLEIARKREELRELAGDDVNTGTFTTLNPHLGSQASTLRIPQITARIENTTARLSLGTRARRGAWLWGAALLGSVLAAWLAFRLTPRLLPARTELPSASIPQAEVKAGPVAGLEQRAARAPRPTVEQLAPSALDVEVAEAIELTPEPEAPTAAPPAPSERRHHRSRRNASEPEPTRPAPNKVEPTLAAGPGTLIVGVANGWAGISIDGREQGNTPLRLELSAGTHQLEARFFGTGTPQSQPVEV